MAESNRLIKINYTPELNLIEIEQSTEEIQSILNKLKIGNAENTEKVKKDLETMLDSIISMNESNDKNSSQWMETQQAIKQINLEVLNLDYADSVKNTAKEIEFLDKQLEGLSENNVDKKVEVINKQLDLQKVAADRDYQQIKILQQAMLDGTITAEQFKIQTDELTSSMQNNTLSAKKFADAINQIKLDQLNKKQSALESAVDMVKQMIQQEAKDQVDYLTDSPVNDNDLKDIENYKKALSELEKDQNKSLKDRQEADKERKKALDEELKVSKKIADQRKKDLKDELKAQKELADESKKRLQDELDGYKAIIDAKKKLLEKESDDRKYKQDLTEKQKEIAKIQDRLTELQFNDSSDARKERIELAEELANKQLDLDNFIYEHSKKAQIDALDSEWERYSKLKEDEKDAIDANLDVFEKSIDAQIDAIEKQQEAQQEAHDATVAMIEDELEAYEKMVEQEIESLKLRGEEYDAQAEKIKLQIEEIQDSIANNGELTRQAMARIDQEGDALYQKLIDWNNIYGSGIEQSVIQVWQEYLDLVDQGNMSTLDKTRTIMQDILDLTRQIASSQASIDYFSGTTGLRDYFENMGYNVGWDANASQLTVGNQYGSVSRNASDYTIINDRIQASWDELYDILKDIPKHDTGAYIKKDHLALVHAGERILNPMETAAFGNFMTNLKSGLIQPPNIFEESMKNMVQREMSRVNEIQSYMQSSVNIENVNIDTKFEGVTSEDLLKTDGKFAKKVADMAFDKVKTVMNRECRAKGVVGKFNPLG